MDQSVENGIGQRWILNFGMPLVNGKLSSQQAGRASIAVIKKVEDVPGVIGGESIAEPFIQKDEVKGGQLLAQFGEGAVDLGKLDFCEEFGGFEIADGVALLAEMVGQHRGQEGFPDAGWPHDDEVEVLAEPLPLSPFQELSLLQPPGQR